MSASTVHEGEQDLAADFAAFRPLSLTQLCLLPSQVSGKPLHWSAEKLATSCSCSAFFSALVGTGLNTSGKVPYSTLMTPALVVWAYFQRWVLWVGALNFLRCLSSFTHLHTPSSFFHGSEDQSMPLSQLHLSAVITLPVFYVSLVYFYNCLFQPASSQAPFPVLASLQFQPRFLTGPSPSHPFYFR